MLLSLHKISKGSLFRNISALVTGAALSQVIAIAFAPIVTRLYGPEAYGVQGVFLSITGIFGTIAAMTYPIAIVLPRNENDALGLVRLSLYITLITSSLVGLFLFFWGSEIFTILNAREILPFMYLIPAAMLISVIGENGGVVVQWAIRKKAFVLIAKAKVAETLLTSVLKTVFGFIHPAALVLILFNTLSALLDAVLILIGLRKKRKMMPSALQHGDNRIHSSLGIFELARKYCDFPFMRTPQILLNMASQSLPIILLAMYFGTTAVGFYSIAMTVLAVPSRVIGDSVTKVFYPRFNDAVHNGESRFALIGKVSVAIIGVGFLPFSIVLIFAPFLFEMVFGSEWAEAGAYAQWIAIWQFFVFCNRPAVAAIPVLRKQGEFLVYEIVSVVLRVAALLFGLHVLKDDLGAVAAFSLVNALLSLSLMMYVIYCCRDEFHRTPGLAANE